MEKAQITIEATIQANIQKVWDCYTQPQHITQWNFATADWQCPSAENDLRVGGKYRARMEAKDGSWGFDFEAIYDSISPLESFSYTMPDQRKVQVNFQAGTDECKVVITFDAETENSIELQRGGWQAILDNFKKYVEQAA